MQTGGTKSRYVGLDAIFQYIGSSVQFFSGMIFYIVISHIFDTTEVGVVAIFVAIIGLFNIVFSFGLSTAAQHFISYNLGKGVLSSVKNTVYKIVVIGVICSSLGFLTLFALSSVLSTIFLHTNHYNSLIKMLGFVLVGNVMFGILNGTMLGIQNFKQAALINIIVWVAYYLSPILFAIYFHSIYFIIIGWIIGIFTGVSFYLVSIIISMQKFSGGKNSLTSLHIVKYSLPILFAGVISYGASYSDRFIVSGFMSLSSLGIYNYALLISGAISFISVPLNNILMPKFSELYGSGNKVEISSYVKLTTTLLAAIFIPVAMGLFILAPDVLYILGGDNYISGAFPLQIILFFSAIFIPQSILFQAIGAVRKTNYFIYTSAISLLTNISFSLLLIPPFGLVGASVGFSSVFAATFLILYMLSKREKIVSFDKLSFVKIWISSLLMVIIIFFTTVVTGNKILLVPLYVFIGSITYVFLARSFKIFGKNDTKYLLSIFPENMVFLRKIVSIIVNN